MDSVNVALDSRCPAALHTRVWDGLLQELRARAEQGRARRTGSRAHSSAPASPSLSAAVLAGDDQAGFHIKEQRKVLAPRQQRAERVDHSTGVRIVQRAGEPFLHALQGQLLARAFQPTEQERARSAEEAELEGRLIVDHEQAPSWPAADLV